MIKTIFGKMFTSTMAAVFLALFIISVIMFGMLGNMLIDQSSERLVKYATQISDFTIFATRDQVMPANVYRRSVEGVARSIDTSVIVVAPDGEIVAAANLPENVALDKSLKKEQFQKTIDGNSIKEVTNFGGMFQNRVLIVSQPVKLDNNVIGGVFLFSSIPSVNGPRYSIFKIFTVSTLVAFVVVFFLTWFLSRKLTNPIKEIGQMAKKISSGDFCSRLVVRSHDEIGQLATTFNSMTDSLENLEKMRSNFVASVSHELRTPMTTISGFVEAILDKTVPEDKQEQYLKIVLSEAVRMSRMVNDLLKIAKLESGSVTFEKNAFELNELIRTALISFERRIVEKNISVFVNFDREKITINSDADALKQVIYNIFDNAAKFTPQMGTINVSVEVKNQTALISVKNSGYGMEPDEIVHIWERFYKSDQSRSIDKTGAGLGLHIVKSILKRIGGDIVAQSVVGEYMEFVVSVPLGIVA